MVTGDNGTGMVGYNVQTAVEARQHLIVARKVTNVGPDRTQLPTIARHTREGMGHTCFQFMPSVPP